MEKHARLLESGILLRGGRQSFLRSVALWIVVLGWKVAMLVVCCIYRRRMPLARYLVNKACYSLPHEIRAEWLHIRLGGEMGRMPAHFPERKIESNLLMKDDSVYTKGVYISWRKEQFIYLSYPTVIRTPLNRPFFIESFYFRKKSVSLYAKDKWRIQWEESSIRKDCLSGFLLPAFTLLFSFTIYRRVLYPLYSALGSSVYTPPQHLRVAIDGLGEKWRQWWR